MPELAVITPTYRDDADVFRELHRSVLEFTPEDTVHHVFVDRRDRHLFRGYEGPRCRVWDRAELLPPSYRHLRGSRYHVDLRRPWPPVRGWIIQQAVKLAASAQSEADAVLLADSDVVLVRPVTADRFRAGGRLVLYRDEKAVTAGMQRHVIWHRVARELLGLPAAPPPPLTDYVSALNVWDPAVVRAVQERIRATTGRDWQDAFNSQLHASEFILYGVFVDEVLSPPQRPPTDISFCHNHWDATPLDRGAALAFADALPAEAVAIMISAKSHTSEDVRQAAIQRCADIVRAG